MSKFDIRCALLWQLPGDNVKPPVDPETIRGWQPASALESHAVPSRTHRLSDIIAYHSDSLIHQEPRGGSGCSLFVYIRSSSVLGRRQALVKQP
jgi:hypothetical protein